MYLSNLIFVVSHLKIPQPVHLNASNSSDVIVVKKGGLLKVY